MKDIDDVIETLIGIIIVILTILAIVVFTFAIVINNNKNKLASLEDITTDETFENVTYDVEEDIWDESVLGILTIDKIDLNVTVKEGTTDDILSNYIGHIEDTSTYDGNIGLAGHNRGFEKSYFARLNELEIGDIIEYKTKFYNRTYVVSDIKVIYETDWSMLEGTTQNKLTLITCVAGKKNQRLCVQSTEKDLQ